MENKTCTKCGVAKPATPEFFYGDKNHSDGLRSDCRECSRIRNMSKHSRIKGRPPDTSPTKICCVCKEERPRTLEFFFRRGKKSWRSYCKSCHANRMLERRKENPAREKAIQNAFYERNREDRIQYARDRRVSHGEATRAIQRACYEKNKDEISAKAKLPENRKAKNEYAKEKRRTDPAWRLRNVLNARLAFCVRRPDRKSKTFVERFGYTPRQLADWIDERLMPGMTWENYGTHWEIDHKRPRFVIQPPRRNQRVLGADKSAPSHKD